MVLTVVVFHQRPVHAGLVIVQLMVFGQLGRHGTCARSRAEVALKNEPEFARSQRVLHMGITARENLTRVSLVRLIFVQLMVTLLSGPRGQRALSHVAEALRSGIELVISHQTVQGETIA